jgi:hypothetical protein
MSFSLLFRNKRKIKANGKTFTLKEIEELANKNYVGLIIET